MNRRANIWRYSYNPDDSVGGAQPTGTVVHWNVPLRMQELPQETLLLQQGYEAQKTFTGVVIPGTLDIRDRDELQVVAPFDDLYYNKYFRVVGAHPSDLNPRDPRNYLRLEMVRSERAHNEQ
jgi:hypothetical protein